MGKIIEEKIQDFSGGITSNVRTANSSMAQAIANFDIYTDPHRLIPYYDSEDGNSNITNDTMQAWTIAIRTGTTYSLYGLGRQTATNKARIFYKDLTTGASTDLDDNGWTETANNTATQATPSYNCFVYYPRTGYIYGAHTGTHIYRYDPSGSGAFSDTHQALSYTNIAQGLVHSKDRILYIPYDNKIAKNDNGSWTTAALTLADDIYITSICEYGNMMAIACAPLSGIGKSRVILWDLDSTANTITEKIDWGSGVLKVLEEVDGNLIGITLDGGNSTRNTNKIVIKYYDGHNSQVLRVLDSGSSTPTLTLSKQKIDNRLYFLASSTLNNTPLFGIWSVGKNLNGQFVVTLDRTFYNDTLTTAAVLFSFFYVGTYAFCTFTNNSTYYLTKTNDTASYTATSFFETTKRDFGDPSVQKSLKGVTITNEPLPANSIVVVRYKTDEDTSWTEIFRYSTQNGISHDAINIESGGATLPEYKEIQFRIESTGGAVITGLSYKAEVLDNKLY